MNKFTHKDLDLFLDLLGRLPLSFQEDVMNILKNKPEMLIDLLSILQAKQQAFATHDDALWQSLIEKEEMFLQKLQEK